MKKFFLFKYFPQKSLGQHFLHDKKIVKKIVDFIHPNYNDFLVEIGPGLAALTDPICALVKHLSVIEIDMKLLLLLKKFNFYKKLFIYKSNVLNFNFKNLFIKHNKLLRIFGNIPYNISVPLILKLLYCSEFIYDINFMVQKEVANRLTAEPGDKSYGRLSIITQCYYDISIGFNILPESFFPIPKVDSSFIRMVPKIIPLYPLNKISNLEKITFLAFKTRRKILKNNFSKILHKDDFLKLNINSHLRAENLSIKEYCNLSDYLLNHSVK
ncbi:16S rRNA (adenine(1518)-N(6)/adenine(1519)-N(6))-dimethyltransferase RsmA [Buchnera aphidicola]|uniref:16S rRNA (adenine(1518)-N(6)/adenine(1519)-N(6))- dimethyltransferase RsmA n=1 Tax=Buchnera aphidicola TaxID=9 RepID=UPI0034646599